MNSANDHELSTFVTLDPGEVEIIDIQSTQVKTRLDKYHAWLEAGDLRELTALERLSLSEQYDMQHCSREMEAMVAVEVEIMITELSARGGGFGKEAVGL
uniref:Uncharacterized protein n=1 Tax=Biomphalaria glabrata TaxID=6526 RepID=A0A2C9JGL8_BIOGL